MLNVDRCWMFKKKTRRDNTKAWPCRQSSFFSRSRALFGMYIYFRVPSVRPSTLLLTPIHVISPSPPPSYILRLPCPPIWPYGPYPAPPGAAEDDDDDEDDKRNACSSAASDNDPDPDDPPAAVSAAGYAPYAM